MDWVSAGLSALQIGSSLLGGKKADKLAQKAAKEQAELTYAQRQEEMRRLRREAAQIQGRAIASVYASNILNTGSASRYLKELDMEHQRELLFAGQAAWKEREAIMAGAKGAGDALLYQGLGDLIGFAAREYTSYKASKATT